MRGLDNIAAYLMNTKRRRRAASSSHGVDVWRPFDLTAGVSVDWVGFVADAFDIANPTGSVTEEPKPGNPLLLLVDDPAVGTIVRFAGNVRDELSRAILYVDDVGLPLRSLPVYIPNQHHTDAVFERGVDPTFADGVTYRVEFR